MAIFNRFRRGPVRKPGNTLNANVKAYLNQYVSSRGNTGNAKLISNIKKFINLYAAAPVAGPMTATNNLRATAQGFAELPGTEAVYNEANRQKNINRTLAEINAAGNNVNKLRGIKTRLNNAGFKPANASNNARAQYNRLNARLAVNQAIKNANSLKPNSNQATINRALNNLRKVQNRAPNTLRGRIANKIANIERMSLLRPPTGSSGGSAPLELNINVPGTNTKVKVRRNNVGSNWNFVNNANRQRYNLTNRGENAPVVMVKNPLSLNNLVSHPLTN